MKCHKRKGIYHEMRKYVGKRKHGSQLTQHEKTRLWQRLYSVQEFEWELSDHALDRVEEKGIRATKQDIISTIYHSEIIEYKIDSVKGKVEERVVLRSKAIVNEEYNLHVVFSLQDKIVVTVWMNHINDRHATLDWSIYDPSMKVFI